MNAVEKLKLNQALKAAIVARDNASSALQKLKLSREVQNLRHKLGLVNTTNGQVQSETQPENSQPDEDMQDAEQKPVVLTGKELGDFDFSTKEGKEALRQAAYDYLNGLAQSGKTVYCPALKAEVKFSKQGAKKFLSFSANPVKSILMAKIEDIIKTGRVFKPSIKSYAGEVGLTYHYLKAAVKVGGTGYGARVVIREDSNGKFHYDLQVKGSIDAILDSTDVQNGGLESVNKSAVFRHSVAATIAAGQVGDSVSVTNPPSFTNSPQHIAAVKDSMGNNARSQAVFDDAEGGYVLNLFVTDADGNEITDKDEGEDTADADDLRFLRQVADMSDEELLDDATGARLADILPKIDGNQALSDAFDAAFKHYDERIVALAETELSDRRGA